jgi:starch synthase
MFVHASTRTPLKILYVAAEAYPLVKTGGLGDVAGSLPPALRKLGVDIQVLLPAYESIRDRIPSLRNGPSLGEPLAGHATQLQYGCLGETDVPVVLVDCPTLFARSGSPYQDRTGHDWLDNHLRFAMLCRVAALLGMNGQIMGWQPDLVHANDWHTGLVPLMMRSATHHTTKSMLTIHNLAYQGLFPMSALDDLKAEIPPHLFDSIEFWGKLSFLKAGIANADCVTTVSPTYAREITQSRNGCGLDGVINARSTHVVGIINGIDDDMWNPATDGLISKNYDTQHLDEKVRNKEDLRRLMGLPPHSDRPLVSVVSRLVDQKGIDVILNAVSELLDAGVDLAILGTGEAALEKAALAAAAARPDRIAVRIAYDESLSHLMIAGSDMLLMPSRFEPCGLTQLYAQRYGTLPVVHGVGGLHDTVQDDRDGFTFDTLSPTALVRAVRRACEFWRDTVAWRYLQVQAMNKKTGWSECATQYRNLYASVIGREAS